MIFVSRLIQLLKPEAAEGWSNQLGTAVSRLNWGRTGWNLKPGSASGKTAHFEDTPGPVLAISPAGSDQTRGRGLSELRNRCLEIGHPPPGENGNRQTATSKRPNTGSIPTEQMTPIARALGGCFSVGYRLWYITCPGLLPARFAAGSLSVLQT